MQRPERSRRRCASIAAAFLLLPGLTASDAAGLERLQRKFDLERGLPFSEVNSIAQDTRGFLWITAGGGLFRYDGVELRPWAREPVRRYMKSVATGPAGEVLVREGPGDSGRLYQVAGQRIEDVEGPGKEPLVITGLPVWDGRSNLWVTAGERVWYRASRGGWRELPGPRFGSERPRLLQELDGGAVALVTENAIWRVDADSVTERLASIGNVQRVLPRADGSFVVLSSDSRGAVVARLARGDVHEIFCLAARPIDMVQQGSTLWVAYDTALVALRPGEPPEVLGSAEGVGSGGPLLVDREGSLWLASFRGLLQYPAPDTVAWLANHATRRLALGPEGIWVDSWTGLTLLRRRGASWEPEPVSGTATSAVCVGSDGAMWVGYAGRVLEGRSGRFLVHPQAALASVDNCCAGAGGRVWLATNLGLMSAGGTPGSSPALRTGPPGFLGKRARMSLLEDDEGQLWVAADEEICHANASAVAAGDPAPWSCSMANGAGAITSLVEVSPGHRWASSLQAGVYREASENHWDPIPGSRMLPTPLVRRLRPSLSGGVWIISFGTILRVLERPGSKEGWEIVERPTGWQGLMISDAEDILEDAAGDLWITTLAGVVRVPAAVRRAAPPVPRVELVDVLVDGKPLPWQQGVTLPYRRNRIELRFAALSYRDPALLRYQVRLRDGAPWLDASTRPSFQFVDLPPGRYQAEVRASLDGTRWSSAPARLAFAVSPPFWRTWWFALLGAVAVASGVHALYRVRVARLLALERVRTSIATDLHDDIGASLSRTAILAEVVRRDVAPSNPGAAEMLDRIARSAREVVDSMSDVVWSLDPERDELGEVVARVRAFASEVLSPRGVGFSVVAPTDAATLATKLGAGPRRQAYLVMKEAVSNVARHARARSASISIGLKDGSIEAIVSDDGCGFPTGSASAVPTLGGNGLRNMKGRASRCRGTLDVDSAPGRGTTITLRIPIGRPGAGEYA
jgi:signal transduction histidine kinase/ligand-binding sensor domain-containing protein